MFVDNSLNVVVAKFNECRKELTDKLEHDHVEGNAASGITSREDDAQLAPLMINVNSLIDGIRTVSKCTRRRNNRPVSGALCVRVAA